MAARGTVKFIQTFVKELAKPNSFDRFMKDLRVVDCAAGQCRCELTVDESHQNKFGTLHGGMTATLVDVVTTCALISHEGKPPGVSVDLNVTYMKSAAVGQDIVVAARTLRVGRSLAFMTADVTRKEDGVLIAQGRHTKFIG